MDHFSCSGVSFLDLFIFLTTAVSGSQRIYPKFPSITKIFNLHRTILPLLLLSFSFMCWIQIYCYEGWYRYQGSPEDTPIFSFVIRISSKVCICSDTYLHLLGGLTWSTVMTFPQRMITGVYRNEIWYRHQGSPEARQSIYIEVYCVLY